MDASEVPQGPAAEVVLSVPEIRDYRAINGELVRHLDLGARSLRLTGANGQRLLVSGLAGPWTAVIEVVGNAGPELAEGLDAAGLTVVCRGSVADGGASGLRAGRVLVLGASRAGLRVCSTRGAGHGGGDRRGPCRALSAWGGLILIGQIGPLAGERQSGGRLLTSAELGPHSGRGRRGGRFIQMMSRRRDPRRGRSSRDDVGVFGVQSLAGSVGPDVIDPSCRRLVEWGS